jgi:hypothetical protein
MRISVDGFRDDPMGMGPLRPDHLNDWPCGRVPYSNA